MPVLIGAVLKAAQAGSLNPLLSPDGNSIAAIYPYTESDTPRAYSGPTVQATDVVVPAQRQLTAMQVPSYFEDYYFRVHLLPNRISLGSLASEQSRTIEVWNAYLTSKTLTEIQIQNGEGMSLLGPSPAPTAFGANESRQYLLSVTPNGPPTVNAQFDFIFTLDTVILRATGRRIVGWVFSPDWSQPVVERLEWLTQVMESYSGIEQRVRLRTGARRSLEYSQLLGSHDERVRMENLVHAWQARVFGLPLWQEVRLSTYTLAAGTTVIPVDTDSNDFVAGGLVGLVFGTDSEFAEITEVQGTGLLLKSPLEKTWPAGTKILPVKPARLQNELKVSYPSDAIVQTRARFQIEDEWIFPVPTEPTQYRGFPVLMTASNWREEIDADHARKLVELDYLSGRRAFDDLSGVGSVRRTHRFLLAGRDAIAEFRAWLAARSGKLNAFWLPSFQADLALASPISAFDTAMTVTDRAFAANGGASVGRRDILISTTLGAQYFRRITGVTPLTESTESVAIDSALGASVLPDQVRYIAFMKLVRLDSDAVEIAHHTDQLAEVTLMLRSIKDDT